MIIVVGLPRTGTSVLVKCLEASGYNIGDTLIGHKYKSQDGYFNKANRDIYKLCGNGGTIEQVRKKVNMISEYCIVKKIDVLKDPWFHTVMSVYLYFSDWFKNQKYIWMHRDALETAKSAVRLKYMLNVPPAESPWTYKTKHLMERTLIYNQVYDENFNNLDSIDVHYEKMLSDKNSVGKKLSEFLGASIDMSLVNTKETWKEKRIPQ